ncbi:hypothetical protein VJJ74_07825, partial [Parvimonas micra]|uniref:hypothetical protein n=3 Tax=Parvimonas TaxID=543311 RepID=UPI002B4742F3
GPATGGLRYRVNEPGVGVEIFEPGQSGTITPLAKMLKGGAGGGNYIDARTTIDARGATPDAVAALEEKMNARDRQLRASLPSMVDNRIMENKWRGRS